MFQQGRFLNVFREDDRGSKAVIQFVKEAVPDCKGYYDLEGLVRVSGDAKLHPFCFEQAGRWSWLRCVRKAGAHIREAGKVCVAAGQRGSGGQRACTVERGRPQDGKGGAARVGLMRKKDRCATPRRGLANHVAWRRRVGCL